MIISPIKTQGRKTRLVEWLSLWTDWYNGGMWIEPFMGSCQVGLSFAPPDGALMCDTNPYLVKLCMAMQKGTVNRESARTFMENESRLLRSDGEIHFMRIRDRFNHLHDPHDLLFLNHACFNGLMRWNKTGDFNTSYGKNPSKFSNLFIGSLCHKVRMFYLNSQKWKFACQDWQKTVQTAKKGDFVYMDPPYEGLDATYFSKWPDGETDMLCKTALKLPCMWAISSWSKSGEKNNPVMDIFRVAGCRIIEKRSQYLVGPAKSRRDVVIECLILPPP